MRSSPWHGLKSSRQRLVRIMLLVVTLLLMAWATPPVAAQFMPEFSNRNTRLTPQDLIPVFTQGNVEIAPVFLDGRIVGAVPGFIQVRSDAEGDRLEAQFSARERSHVIHSRLTKILTNLQVYSSSKLRKRGITESSSQEAILENQLNVFVEQKPQGFRVMVSFPKDDPPDLLYTITPADVARVRLESSNPEEIARRVAGITKMILLRAWLERQPDVLLSSLRRGLMILLGVSGISGLILIVQKRLKRIYQVVSSRLEEASHSKAAAESSEKASFVINPRRQITLRQQISLISFYRSFLYWSQWLLWIAGVGFLLGMFFVTRPLRNWFLGVSLRHYFTTQEGPPISWPPLDWFLSFGQHATIGLPLLILLLIMLTRISIRTGNLLCDLYIQRWAAARPADRLRLRAPTLSRALKGWVSVGIYAILGMVIVYQLHELGAVTQAVAIFLGFLSFALSLASQNLLKDLIGGFLILMEDQYAVGDVVIVDDQGGLVEEVGLRVTKLRNLDGELITIPNGSVGMVRNLSSNWSRVNYAIEVGVSEDADRVMEIMNDVAIDLFHDPAWREMILEAPEILGIDEITHHGVLIRMLIRTRPLQQWAVAREYRRRLKIAFDTAGISVGVPRLELQKLPQG